MSSEGKIYVAEMENIEIEIALFVLIFFENGFYCKASA